YWIPLCSPFETRGMDFFNSLLASRTNLVFFSTAAPRVLRACQHEGVRQIQYARRHFSRDAFQRSFLAIGDQKPAASP
ncbi:MAG: hypothetical protein WAN05_23740, partial [Roseiarcus sp.]